MQELINAKRDYLTNCFTKEELRPFLSKVLLESGAYKKAFSILVIDVDKFKSFNDKYGHLCGDEVLKYFSSTLRLSLEGVENMPFRFGGDEFVVVFPGASAADAYLHAVKIIKNVRSRHFLLKGHQFRMSFSGGIASFPADAKTVDALLENADKAMYFSKKHGHGKTTLYNKIWKKRILEILFILAVFLAIFGVASALVMQKNFKPKFSFSAKAVKIDLKSFLNPAFWEKYNPKYLFISKKDKSKRQNVSIKKRTSAPQPQISEKDLDAIYLKSGAVLRGIIIRQDYAEVELKVIFDEGEGTIVIKDFEIQKIEKNKK